MEGDPDPPVRRRSVETEQLQSSQRIAGVVLSGALVLLGLWILHRFLPALVWAVVLAIALWPLYRRLLATLPARRQRMLAPLLLTLLIGLVCVVPFLYIAVEGARETRIAVLSQLRHDDILNGERSQFCFEDGEDILLGDEEVMHADGLVLGCGGVVQNADHRLGD